MVTMDLEDAFWGEGFGTGAILDMVRGGSTEAMRTWHVLLCVRRGFNTPKKSMRLYVQVLG